MLNQGIMRTQLPHWKGVLTGLVLGTLSFASIGASTANAAVVVIHDGPRAAPPHPREERVIVRRGYVWSGGHYEWRHHRYVWVRGHHLRERPGYDWVPGHWEHHEGHYDWYRGEWHPHR